MQNTVERIHIGKQFGDIPRGIYLIRGENVALCGEIVSHTHTHSHSRSYTHTHHTGLGAGGEAGVGEGVDRRHSRGSEGGAGEERGGEKEEGTATEVSRNETTGP